MVKLRGCDAKAGPCRPPLPAGNRCQQGRTADGPGAHRYGVAGPRQHGAVAGGVLPGNRLPKSLGFTVGGLRFRVVHGGVDVINRFLFRSGRAAIAAELARAGSDIVIAGHCGIPFIARAGGRVWFNPGVIGMPANDGTTDTRFGLIEAGRDHLTLSTHRLAYDHASAAAAMRRWGHTDLCALADHGAVAEPRRFAGAGEGGDGKEDTAILSAHRARRRGICGGAALAGLARRGGRQPRRPRGKAAQPHNLTVACATAFAAMTRSASRTRSSGVGHSR